MLELPDDFVLEPTQAPVNVFPPKQANEQAFYTTELHTDNPAEQHEPVRLALEQEGHSDFRTQAIQRWKDEQNVYDQDILTDIVADPGIDLQQKKDVLRAYESGKTISENIRDQFIQESAARVVSPAGVEDVPVRQQDIEAQDIWIETLRRKTEIHNETQMIKASYNLVQEPGVVGAAKSLAGFLGDVFIPGLFNYRAFHSAKEIGVALQAEEGEGTQAAINNMIASFLFSGSLNVKVNEVFETLPPEQQREAIRKLMNAYEDVPGGEFSRKIQFIEQIDDPLQSPTAIFVQDALAALGVLPIARAISAPFRFYNKVSGQVPPGFGRDIPSAEQVFRRTPEITEAEIVSEGARSVLEAPTVSKRTLLTGQVERPPVELPDEFTLIRQNEVINLPDNSKHYSSLREEPDVEFSQPSTGTMPVEELPVGDIPAQRTQAATELLDVAKELPSQNGLVSLDDLHKAVGGNKTISLRNFNNTLEDLHKKNLITLERTPVNIDVADVKQAKLPQLQEMAIELNVPIQRGWKTKDYREAISDAIKTGDTTDFGFIRIDAQPGGPKLGSNEADIDTLVNNILQRTRSGSRTHQVAKTAQTKSQAVPGVPPRARTEAPETLIRRRTEQAYVPSARAEKAGHPIVRVGTQQFDEAFKQNLQQYVNVGAEGGNKGRYNNVVKFINNKKNKQIQVSEVLVDEAGKISFVDGSHRYAVLRDSGISKIPVTMDPDSVRNAIRHGYIEDVASNHPISNNVPLATSLVKPSVDPNSPAGTLGQANPVMASNKALDAIQDLSGETARRMGTSRAELFSSWILPKLDRDIGVMFPGLAKKFDLMDENFKALMARTAVNPDITPITAKQKEVDLFVDSLREIRGATYQQQNSTLDFGRGRATGIAVYGRNADSGYTSIAEVNHAYDKLIEQRPEFPARIIEKDKQYYIEQEWEYRHSPVDAFVFDVHSMDASFAGIDVSGFSRTPLADYVFPKTMRADDFIKKASNVEVRVNASDAAFMSGLTNEVNKMKSRELSHAINATQEEGAYMTVKQLVASYPHLSKAQQQRLVNGYYAYKRLADYAYEVVNRVHTQELASKGHKAIYLQDGTPVGFGTENFPASELETARRIWDYDLNQAVDKPDNFEGRTVVRLNENITIDEDVFEFAILGNQAELGVLPIRTLPRVEGYVPRRNAENHYIRAVPTKANVNGRAADAKQLEALERTIGAARTKAEADLLLNRLQKEPEYANYKLDVRLPTENIDSFVIGDMRRQADLIRNTKKRGERLPTLDGFARLVDPLEELSRDVKTAVRTDLWQEYKQQFEEGFTKFAGKFFKDPTKFPNTPQDLMPLETMTPTELKEFKVAQRLFNQYLNMQYMTTLGDSIWKNGFHGIADALENVNLVGLSEFSRDVGNQGNLVTRGLKSTATQLFIYLNPLKQYFIQPQKILELTAISPSYLFNGGFEQSAALSLAVLTRAPHGVMAESVLGDIAKKVGINPEAVPQLIYDNAHRISGLPREEFDKLVDIFYNSGLPQSVDLNSMLQGGLFDLGQNLDPTPWQTIGRGTRNAVSTPGAIGRNIGYSKAELGNIANIWMWTRNRWINNNPGKDWSLPENVAEITRDSLDIGGSMVGQAASFDVQRGFLSIPFQFLAHSQKTFFEVFSSKTFTKTEMIKLGAARLALYGLYGAPFGAGVITSLILEHGDEDVIQAWHDYGGGAIDWSVNNTLDVLFSDPDEPASDLAVSKWLSPMPDNFPLVDLVIEMSQIFDERAPNPRLPAFSASGSLFEAVRTVQSIFRTREYNNEQSLLIAGHVIAQSATGYNNYGKAAMIKAHGDKIQKNGDFFGLHLNQRDMIAQLFGVTTKGEDLYYRSLTATERERNEFVSQRINEILNDLEKISEVVGTDEHDEILARMEVLNSHTPEEDQEAVKRGVLRGLGTTSKGTSIDRIIENIYRHYEQGEITRATKMLNVIRASAQANPKVKELEDIFRQEGFID